MKKTQSLPNAGLTKIFLRNEIFEVQLYSNFWKLCSNNMKEIIFLPKVSQNSVYCLLFQSVKIQFIAVF